MTVRSMLVKTIIASISNFLRHSMGTFEIPYESLILKSTLGRRLGASFIDL